jgi:hypothetical protein
MLYSFIFKARRGGFELVFARDCGMQDILRREHYATLREAKRWGNGSGVKPWNFIP